tara:strand:- start:2226 stop:2477 length:252 start_codon:yes stop_codon:yes gene_type:complete
MGSKRSTGSSPGERKAKTGNDLTIPDQAKIQGKKADAFARKAVGLKNTDDGYISTAYDSATENLINQEIKCMELHTMKQEEDI